jgi:uncharacterized protein YndB with AHSA1/START domain
MIRKAAIVFALLLAALLATAYAQPDQFTVTRTRTIAAAPERVFAELVSFRNWARWSPWEKLDPQMKKEFSGPPSGPQAAYHWVGNDDVGEGRMTILSVTPNQRVEIRLEFLKPFAATNQTIFSLTPAGEKTEVTWEMRGNQAFMMKVFSLFMNMDKTVGADFEKGLAGLEQAAHMPAAN